MSDRVECCFCGEGLDLNVATTLVVRTPVEPDSPQTLWCHALHLAAALRPGIPLLAALDG